MSTGATADGDATPKIEVSETAAKQAIDLLNGEDFDTDVAGLRLRQPSMIQFLSRAYCKGSWIAVCKPAHAFVSGTRLAGYESRSDFRIQAIDAP